MTTLNFFKDWNRSIHKWMKWALLITIIQTISFPAFTNEKSTADLLVKIKEVQNQFKIPNIGLSIFKDSTLVYSGTLNLSSDFKKNTHFRQGSLTKTFVALGLLELEKQGKLKLDSPISILAPELGIENEFESQITLRHLLEHTAGLSDMSFSEIKVKDHHSDITAKEVFDLTNGAKETRWAPGKYFSYSNPGYLIAGYILEKYARMPFEEFIKAQIFDKYEMNNSTLDQRTLSSEEKPTGYIYKNGKYEQNDNLELSNRWAGSLVSTPSDMANFIIGLLNDYKNPSGHSIYEQMKPRTSEASKEGFITGYGSGFEYVTNRNIFQFGNRGGGYNLSTMFRVQPQNQSGYYLGANTSSNPGMRIIEGLIIEFLNEGESNTTRITPQPISPEEARNINGYYQLRSHRFNFFKPFERLTMGMELYVKNDTIFRRNMMGNLPPAFMATEGKFYVEGSLTPHLQHAESNEGWTLTETNYSGQYFVKSSKSMIQAKLFGVLASIVLILISTAVLIIKVIRKTLKKDFQEITPSILIVVGSAMILLPINHLVGLHLSDFETLGSINGLTISILIASVLYPLILVSIFITRLKTLKSKTRRYKILSGVLYTAHAGFILFLFNSHYIGVMLWKV